MDTGDRKKEYLNMGTWRLEKKEMLDNADAKELHPQAGN
jgi:hypothetical protein